MYFDIFQAQGQSFVIANEETKAKYDWKTNIKKPREKSKTMTMNPDKKDKSYYCIGWNLTDWKNQRIMTRSECKWDSDNGGLRKSPENLFCDS